MRRFVKRNLMKNVECRMQIYCLFSLTLIYKLYCHTVCNCVNKVEFLSKLKMTENFFILRQRPRFSNFIAALPPYFFILHS